MLQDVLPYLQKSKRYCETCKILFSESSNYENHLKLYHPQKCLINYSKSKILVKRSYKKVKSQLVETAMELSRNSSPIQQNHTATLSKKKLVQNNFENNNSDLSNTCFHCKQTFATEKSLIEHLYDILKTKRTESEIIPVLKSVLFRCNKCDIYFVSSQVAANHSDHMEMLINWKCSICYRIFKKEDEFSHERQHSVSNNFVIYNFSDLDLNKVMFKCSKCSGHFSESKFLYHFRDCGLKSEKLQRCRICNILIDSSLVVSHDTQHKSSDLNVNQFTVIETEVISDNPVKSKIKGSQMNNKLNNIAETIREVKVVVQRLDTVQLNPQNKSTAEINSQSGVNLKYQKNYLLQSSKANKVIFDNTKIGKNNILKMKSMLTKTKHKGNDEEIWQKTNNSKSIDLKKLNQAYFYCDDCTCFIPKHGNIRHLQSRCTNLKKLHCKYCGLTLTMTSFRTHKRLHEKRRDFKLNDFNFFNLNNGRRITPPIPKYPHCGICDVHFVSKTSLSNHVCSEEAYLTCQICTMKLSEAAFKLHMMFHNYSMKHNNKMKIKTAVSANSVWSSDDVNNVTEKKHIENSIKLQKSTQHLHDSSLQSDVIRDSEIIYTCRNCKVTVDTYDKVVEHCHGHYNEKEIETETCTICSLQIEMACYRNHKNLHNERCTFKILKFDSYYFPIDHDMWLEHVFKSIPKEKSLEILGKSIYRYEGRIKMDVTQQGSHKWTVYKCDQCQCFIEPTSLFKHADNSCFKLRKHPCTICGLPFISSASRIDHEKIHKSPGITFKSYRIVLFNREEDKQFNSNICFRKRYILYQCRNCDEIIDRLQTDIHECNISRLKKCPDCNLLLNTEDYEKHAAEHKELASFNYRNMKVILLGEIKNGNETEKKVLKSSFRGVICDYKMYKCNNCQICIKDEKLIPKHSCYFGRPHSKCPKCELYFSVSRLKTHLRSHERDPDLLRENMTIIAFDPNSCDQNKNTTTQAEVDCELTDSNDDSDSDIVFKAEEKSFTYNGESSFHTREVVEETAKVYKCTCGLHFLNEDSIARHFGVCRSNVKLSRQKCPKCDLLFTSNILFTHLLAHHSNKCRRFKYDIIERTKSTSLNIC